MPIAVIVIMFLGFLTLLLLVVGLMMKSERQLILERVRKYGFEEATQAPVLADDLTPPFAERVVRPLLQRLGRMGAGAGRPEQARDIRQKLEMAGNPYDLSPVEFSAIKGLSLGVGLVLGLAIAAFGGLDLQKAVLAVVLLAALGFFIPGRWLDGRIAWRKNEITRSLPNSIDLLNVSVDAGLGFDGALARIVEKSKGPLADEFGRALREMRVGKTRSEALRDMATRVGVPDLTGFVAAVYQAEELGASLTTVLRVQAQMIRNKRRIRAREAAAKLPVKMLFPLVFFVFPSIFIVILGPGAIQLMHSAVFAK